jgi:hypothetical protein
VTVAPFYGGLRPNPWRRRIGRVNCPACGFAAEVVTNDLDADPWTLLLDLIESDCFGCVECHDGDLVLTADFDPRPARPLHRREQSGPAGST